MDKLARIFFSVFTGLTLGLGSVWAQTPPPAETTYTDAGDGLWITGANWDSGVPTDTGTNPALDDARIATGESVFYDADISGGAIGFGTLVIGENATFLYDAIGGSNTDFTNGNDIYFLNNSQLTINSALNSAIDYRIASGDSATVRFNAGVQNRPRGTIEGAGNLTFLMDGWVQQRWDAKNFTGDMTFTAVSGTRNLREFGGFISAGDQVLGQGNNTIGDNVYIDYQNNNVIPDNATLTLVGDGGSAGHKLDMRNRDETIAHLVIDSPTGLADTIERDNGSTLTVSDTMTFQGTAGTVRIDDTSNTGVENAVVADNLDFQGTGDWIVSGDGRLAVNDGTINTASDATISAPLSTVGTVEKTGAGKLTLQGTTTLGGDFTVSAGTFEVDGGTITGAGTVIMNNIFTIGDTSGGNAISSATISDLTLGDDSTFQFTVNGDIYESVPVTDPPDYKTNNYDTWVHSDFLSVTTLDLGNSPLIELGVIGVVDLTQEYVLFEIDNGAGDFSSSFNANSFDFTGNGLTQINGQPIVSLLVNGGPGNEDLILLSFSAYQIPEPTTMTLYGLGGLFVYLRRRSMFRKLAA